MRDIFMGMALAVLTSTAALAQAPPAEPEYTIKLRQSQLDTFFMGMTKVPMPYERTAPLLQDVSRQVQEQDKANQEKAAAAKAEAEKAKGN